MSTYRPKANEKLVGRRISDQTALGQELGKLRDLYRDADKIDERTFDEKMKDTLNASLKVKMADGIERDNRKRAVRKQLVDAIYATEVERGHVPLSVGVPKEFVEEARAALKGTKYDGVKVTVST